MLKSDPGAQLTVLVDNLTVRFTSIDDLKFALEGKTELPVSKYDELRALSLDSLRKQAIDIRKVEGRLLQILDSSDAEAASLDYELRDMDPRVFSEDHGWRALVAALINEGPKYSDFKRVALVKYLQYLASRQELIKRVYWNKHPQGEHSNPEDAGRNVKDTFIFDGNEFNELRKEDEGKFERLPRGEPRDVRLLPGQQMGLRLSVHSFKLVRADGAYLVDENGKEYPLNPRRSSIGRSNENDVILDAAYRAISRKHLVLEFPSKDRVILTDRSSHGTFVPLKHLAEG